MKGNGKRFSGRVIMASDSDYVDQDSYEIKPIPAGADKKEYQPKTFFDMYWIGVYPFRQIDYQRQQWIEWRIDKDTKQLELIVRNELTPYLVTKQFAYGQWLMGAENIDKLPLDLKFTIFVKPTNAVRPRFLVDASYSQLQGIVLATAALYLKMKTFESLQSSGPTNLPNEHDEFSQVLCTLNDKIPGMADIPVLDGEGNPTTDANGKAIMMTPNIINLLGYKLMGAKIHDVSIAGPNKEEISQATIKVYLAGQNKQAKIVEAEGNSQAEKVMSDAKAYDMGIRTAFYTSIANMDHAQQIELAKKMFEDSKLTTYVSGKDVTPTIPVNNN
jgi:S-ribosylhomocysteine lyase LuxS involved in autoinducer biosynthesis